MNRVLLIGRLGNDPEVKHTNNGTAVANVNMATSKRYKDKDGAKQEKTSWHRLVAFGKTAEIMGEYLSKGSQCAIVGELETRQWDDKEGNKRYTTEVIVNELEFIGPPKDGGGGNKQQDRQDDVPMHPSVIDDSVPF